MLPTPVRLSILSRFRTPTYPNTGSVARDHLASERTFLAWMRTGLGFIALGIAVERFSQLDIESILGSLHSPQEPLGTKNSAARRQARSEREADRDRQQLLVAALLGLGTGSIVYGATRYFSNLRLLERGAFRPAFHGAGVLSVGVAGVAGAAYWSTLKDERRRSSSRK